MIIHHHILLNKLNQVEFDLLTKIIHFGKFLKMMPHLVGNFSLPSRALNEDLKVPLERLGCLVVNKLFERVKQTLHGSDY